MLLKFIDVFRFFSEVEFTDEQRKYELIAVSVLCAVLAVVTITLIIRTAEKRRKQKEIENDSEQKSGD